MTKDKRTKAELLEKLAAKETEIAAAARLIGEKDERFNRALAEMEKGYEESLHALRRNLLNTNIAKGNLETTLQETALETVKVVHRLLGKNDGLAAALKIALKKGDDEDGPEVSEFTEKLDDLLDDLNNENLED